MKKTILFLLTLLLLVVINVSALAAAYTGNRNSHKFHYSSCRYVAQMKESNKVAFSSRQQAIDSGYIACKVCRP